MQEILDHIKTLFRGRLDVVPRFWQAKKDPSKRGYTPICRNEWKDGLCEKPCRTCSHADYVPLSDELLVKHIKGKEILGVYPLLADNTCAFVAADFDQHAPDDPGSPLEDVQAFHSACETQEIPCYALRSKSGHGYHAYIFFSAPVAAWKARAVCFALLQEAQVIGQDTDLTSFDRLFPNQDKLSGRGFGNLIALPFQGTAAAQKHTLFLDPLTGFEDPYPSQKETLRTIQRIPETTLDALVVEWDLKPTGTGTRGAGGERVSSSSPPSPTCPAMVPSQVLAGVPESQRDTTLFRYACRLRAQGLGREETEVLILSAAAACSPPFPREEALSKVDSAWKYNPGPRETSPEESKQLRENLAARIQATDDFDELTVGLAQEVTTAELPAAAKQVLRKIISKKARVSVSTLLEDARQFVHTDSSKHHLQAARAVVESYGAGNILNEPAGWSWKWNGCGVWKRLENRELKQRIHEVTGSPDLTKGTIESILDMTLTEIFRPHHRWDLDRDSINARNGELHWTGDAWDLREHDRERYRTTQISAAYTPGAQAPRFLQFLDEIFEPDEDRPEKKQIVLEGIGYTLMATCMLEKFFLLIGEGANGKSVLIDTIAHLVGDENVSAVQPSQFENRFQRAHLRGRLMNQVTEIAEGHEIADAQLKAIVSGELTTAEHKHKAPFDFHPFCTCWFGTNHMPHTRDFSDALFRRAILLTFNRKFREDEDDDKRLRAALRAEAEGILNLALEAVGKVLSRGSFTKAKSSEAAKLDWRLNCDQVAQFVSDRCKLGPECKAEGLALWKGYQGWAEDMGIRKTVGRKTFTQRLERMGLQRIKLPSGARGMDGIAIDYRKVAEDSEGPDVDT